MHKLPRGRNFYPRGFDFAFGECDYFPPLRYLYSCWCAENNIHPNMLSKWKREAETQLYTLFQDNSSKERKAQKAREAEINDLYAQIGKLTTQNEWLKKKSGF